MVLIKLVLNSNYETGNENIISDVPEWTTIQENNGLVFHCCFRSEIMAKYMIIFFFFFFFFVLNK